MSEFSDFTDRVKNGDESLFLGYLVWYSVSNVRVAHQAVIAAMVHAGIDKSLPLPPKESDVFRRVASKSERKRIPTVDAGIFENFLVRDLNADNEKVYKRIVGEKVDENGRKLGYEQLYDVTFDKASSNIMTRRLGPVSQIAEEIVTAIQTGFNLERGTLNSYAVREWIRHFVVGLSATQVRPGGGVYFLRQEHKDKIAALEQFATSLPGDVVFHSLPLIDDRKQREMLKAAFESETADEIDKLITEIGDIKANKKKVSATRYEEYLNKYHALVERTNEYSELLEEKMSTTHSRLEIFMREMVQLTALKKS